MKWQLTNVPSGCGDATPGFTEIGLPQDGGSPAEGEGGAQAQGQVQAPSVGHQRFRSGEGPFLLHVRRHEHSLPAGT